MMKKDFKDLRDNFGLFATGVAVATTTNSDNNNLITINSFSSISLDPALLLFCIDNNSHNFNAFTNNKSFAINLLTTEQKHISKIFSSTGKKDYDLNKLFFKSNFNNLILNDCLGYFECDMQNVIPAGDHNIIVGRVVNFSKIKKDSKPLIYFKGDYQELK